MWYISVIKFVGEEMKISMVIVEGAKQIMITPETEHEKEILRYIEPTDELSVVSKSGSFGDKYRHLNYQVAECQGGYYRPFEDTDSLMFIIKEKEKKK